MKINRGLMAVSLLTAGIMPVMLAAPAQAQHGGFQVHQKKLDKANFYSAPRQMQILDERPIIKDFREAPASSPMIALPPGPQGAAGGYGGNGAGALGDMPGGGGGSAPVQIGGAPGQAPYRTSSPSSLPLPKSGFDRSPSNIPAGGLGPRNALPSGQTTNRLMGKMMPPTKAGPAYTAGSPRGLAPAGGRTKGTYKGPAAASYSGGYGSGSGSGYGGSANRTEGIVRGSLLKKTK